MLVLLMLLLFDSDLPVQDVLQQISETGRVVASTDAPDIRVSAQEPIAPGLPPLLSFRYYEDKKNQRFANLDLMLDDAGH